MSSLTFREGGAWQGGGVPGGAIVYPARYFSRAYLRMSAGFACTLSIWFLAPASPGVSVICFAGVLAFAWYGGQTGLRQMSNVSWDGEGIHIVGPLPRRLAWADLTAVRLAYFSTRRDGSDGWMQLKISSRNGTLRLDSDAAGFDRLVIVAMHHADRLGLDVTTATRHNAAVLFRPGGLRPSQ